MIKGLAEKVLQPIVFCEASRAVHILAKADWGGRVRTFCQPSVNYGGMTLKK